MAGEVYNAAHVIAFQELLQRDACSRNLLHIATMKGHEGIVDEVVEKNPQLARDLDSQKSSPLHIAAAQRNLYIIFQKLLAKAPEMCWSRDCQGMNPIHIAAMNGNVEIVRVLLAEDYLPAALERVHRGQTVLHLYVKHRHRHQEREELEMLKVLVEKLGELVCAKDDDGETLLHWAVRCKQVEIIQYLVKNTQIQKQWTNSTGKTALDILKESPLPQDRASQQMRKILDTSPLDSPFGTFIFFDKKSSAIMMVAILIATMAFDAAISPPGGVWPDDSSQHRAGEAVMAYTHPFLYKFFYQSNSIAFVSSILAIFLTATQLATKAPIISVAVYYNMTVSLLAIFCSYGASIIGMTPGFEMQFAFFVVHIFLSVLVSVVGSLLVGVVLSYRRRRPELLSLFIGRSLRLLNIPH